MRTAALAAVCLAATGCAGPATFGLAPSLMPNLGLAASLSAPARATSAWELEARFTDQFVDDKTFADNGFPEAGNWTQLDLGLLRLKWNEGRAWSTRFGLTGFTARGEPNLAEESGDYLGAYFGLGRFTRFGANFAFGPELTLIAATGPDPLVLIPQLTWGVRWTPGAR
jgi:hypothetical protein